MGTVRGPAPARLICGILSRFPEACDWAKARLGERFGPIDLASDAVPFDFTDYYAAEMGAGLLRWFVSFAQLIPPEELVEAKLFTNELEAELASSGRFDVARPINLDPGLVTASKLVLATTKDYSHRIYLGRGIYAEVTLRYEKKAFRPWPWTYPDYRTEAYGVFFEEVRRRWLDAHSER